MELTREQFIEGLEQRIKDLENYASEYWRGVRDGYISTLETINKFPPVVSGERPDWLTRLSMIISPADFIAHAEMLEASGHEALSVIFKDFGKAFQASTASVAVERPVEGGTEGKELGI